MKPREDNIQWPSQAFFQNCPLRAYIEKKSIDMFTFWCMDIPLGPHSIYTPFQGPKNFVNLFFKESNHGCWTTKSAKGRPPWSDFMVHGVNRPLKKSCQYDEESLLGPTFEVGAQRRGTKGMVSDVHTTALVPKRIGRLSSRPDFREFQGSKNRLDPLKRGRRRRRIDDLLWHDFLKPKKP